MFVFQAEHNAKLIFLLGTTSTPDPELEQRIAEETALHGDLVREDFLDTYQNLTLKTLAGVKWAGQFCGQAEFVMKTDDDMYVNVGEVMEYLLREQAGKPKAGITLWNHDKSTVKLLNSIPYSIFCSLDHPAESETDLLTPSTKIYTANP